MGRLLPIDASFLSLSTWSSLCILAFCLSGVFIVIIGFYRVFFSPLSYVPGPWYAAVSEFWLITHVLRLQRCRAIDGLLRKYGPVVRVAPNKVVFLDAQTLKAVYGVGSKLDKSAFYKSLTINMKDHAMTTLDHASHMIRKRGYAPHYNPANLYFFQPEIHKYTCDLVNLLSAASTMSPMAIDTLLLFRHYFIDINCAHLFDYDANSLKAWSEHVLHGKSPDGLSQAISDFPKRGLLQGALPAWLWSAVQRIPIRRWQTFCASNELLCRFALARLHESRLDLYSEKACIRDTRESLIMRLLSHKYTEQEVMPDEDILAECVGHLIAGTDTTSTTLSFLLWELSRRHDIMLRLQTEVDEYMPDPSHIPDIQDLHRLPYLAAVIKEGLRVYSAAPSPLERVVPSHGDSEINILGCTIPPGTVVASQAFSSHRLDSVFFCPNLFIPDRWLMDDYSTSPCSISIPTTRPTTKQSDDTSPDFSLSASQILSDAEKGSRRAPGAALDANCPFSKSRQTEMSAHMFPFGHGPRVCGGQNMAQMMLRIVLVAIARNFDILAPPETNEQSMAMRDSFVAFPAALECKLIFVPRR